jgi:hypothetical protein
MDFDTPDQLEMQAAYRKHVIAAAAQACRTAAEQMQPARLTVGWGECAGNINRRQREPGGDILLGEDPDGVCDRSVGVIRVDDGPDR